MYFNRKDKNETYFASGSVSSFCNESYYDYDETVHMYCHKTASWHDYPRSEFPEEEQQFFNSDNNAIIFTCENYRGVSYDVIVFPFVYWDPNMGDLFEPKVICMNPPPNDAWSTIRLCRFKRYVSGAEYEQMVKEYQPYG